MNRQKISPAIVFPELRRRHAVYDFLQRSQARGKVAFALGEVCKQTGVSPVAALAQLSRLKAQVVRVSPKADFYLIIRPDQALMGGPPADWWLHAYFQSLGRPYYVGLLSAAAEYGSSHQAVQTFQVMTDRPMGKIHVGRISVEFFVRKNIAQVATRLKQPAFAPLLLSTPEATAIDLIRYSSRIGGIARAALAIQGMIEQFTANGIASALESGVEQPTLQRLGYILQKFQPGLFSEAIAQELRKGRKRQVYLEPEGDDITDENFRESAKWGIIENVNLDQLS
jgi:hypothetical protein